MNRARLHLFGIQSPLYLSDVLELATFSKKDWIKCRITYAASIKKIEYEPYHIRPVQSLQLVTDNTIEYSYKYQNRTRLDALFAQRGTCDNILIIKNGFITDSYYANVVFENAKGYFTPNTPLLAGVKRQVLVDTLQIQTAPIRLDDIGKYEEVHLINAFLNLGDCVLDVASILPERLVNELTVE